MLRCALLALISFTLTLSAADPVPDDAKTVTAPPTIADRTFAITLVSSDGGDKNEDVLIFAEGALSSRGYAESRFNPGKVTVIDKGDVTTFTATMISPRGAEATWSGKISGDQIEGKVLTGVRGRIDVSTFTGTLQK